MPTPKYPQDLDWELEINDPTRVAREERNPLDDAPFFAQRVKEEIAFVQPTLDDKSPESFHLYIIKSHLCGRYIARAAFHDQSLIAGSSITFTDAVITTANKLLGPALGTFYTYALNSWLIRKLS